MPRSKTNRMVNSKNGFMQAGKKIKETKREVDQLTQVAVTPQLGLTKYTAMQEMALSGSVTALNLSKRTVTLVEML